LTYRKYGDENRLLMVVNTFAILKNDGAKIRRIRDITANFSGNKERSYKILYSQAVDEGDAAVADAAALAGGKNPDIALTSVMRPFYFDC